MSTPDWTKLFASIDTTAQTAASITPPPAPADEQPAAAPLQQIAPGVFDMAASFTGSMAQFAASGFRTVSDEVYQARFAKCSPCDQYSTGFCNACGCYLDAKVRLPHEACPLGKWHRESV